MVDDCIVVIKTVTRKVMKSKWKRNRNSVSRRKRGRSKHAEDKVKSEE